MEALLAYEFSPHYELHHRDVADRLATGLGHGASSVWAAGLPGADADLFHTVVDSVAADGRLRLPGVEPGLGQGAAARMDVVEARINDGFRLDTQEGTRRFEDTAVFLREVMRHEDTAATLRSAAGEHLQDRLEQLPAPGPDRDAAVQVAGRTMGVLAQANANAAIANGQAADAVDGANADAVDYLASWVPGVGPVNDLLGGAGGGVGEWLFGDSRADEAGDAAQRRIFLADRALAATVAMHHVESGTIDPRARVEAAWSAVEALDLDIDRATVDRLFLDPAGNPRPSLPPVDQMTPAERRAFYAWVFRAELPAAGPAQTLPRAAFGSSERRQQGGVRGMSRCLVRLTLVVMAFAVLVVAPACGDPAEPTDRTLGGARLVGVELAEDVRAYDGLPADQLPFNDLRGARDLVADGEGGLWLLTTVDLIHVDGDGTIDAHTTQLMPLHSVGSLALAPDGHLVMNRESGATWLAPLGPTAERNADVDFGVGIWSDTLGLGFRYADMSFLPDGTWLVSSLSGTVPHLHQQPHLPRRASAPGSPRAAIASWRRPASLSARAGSAASRPRSRRHRPHPPRRRLGARRRLHLQPLRQRPAHRAAARGCPVALARNGHVRTDQKSRTSLPTFFAAGDVTNRHSHQVVAAVHEGAAAAMAANHVLYPALQRL